MNRKQRNERKREAFQEFWFGSGFTSFGYGDRSKSSPVTAARKAARNRHIASLFVRNDCAKNCLFSKCRFYGKCESQPPF